MGSDVNWWGGGGQKHLNEVLAAINVRVLSRKFCLGGGSSGEGTARDVRLVGVPEVPRKFLNFRSPET